MTPIARFLNRILPRQTVPAALGLIYAVMLISVVALAGYGDLGPLVYLDVPRSETELLPFRN